MAAKRHALRRWPFQSFPVTTANDRQPMTSYSRLVTMALYCMVSTFEIIVNVSFWPSRTFRLLLVDISTYSHVVWWYDFRHGLPISVLYDGQADRQTDISFA